MRLDAQLDAQLDANLAQGGRRGRGEGGEGEGSSKGVFHACRLVLPGFHPSKTFVSSKCENHKHIDFEGLKFNPSFRKKIEKTSLGGLNETHIFVGPVVLDP